MFLVALREASGIADWPDIRFDADSVKNTMSADARRIYSLAMSGDGPLSKRLKVAPKTGLFFPKSCPPWASTIEREMDRPIPIPSFLVVTNASKTFSVL